MISRVLRKYPRPVRTALRFARYHAQNLALMARVRFVDRQPAVPGRVTLVTPTHRRLAQLREAIESVLAQGYQDFEQLVIADGHDASARDLVRSFADERIRYHHTRPFHVSGNYQRNFALRFATGEFVMYLDDDNVIYPHCLATMVKGFEREGAGFVVGAIHYGAERRVMTPTPAFKVQQIDTLSFMVRRELVEKVRGYGSNYSADYGFINKIARIARGNFLTDIIGHHR